MPNGTYGGVRGRKTKVGRKLSFSSYSITIPIPMYVSYVHTYDSNILRILSKALNLNYFPYRKL